MRKGAAKIWLALAVSAGALSFGRALSAQEGKWGGLELAPQDDVWETFRNTAHHFALLKPKCFEINPTDDHKEAPPELQNEFEMIRSEECKGQYGNGFGFSLFIRRSPPIVNLERVLLADGGPVLLTKKITVSGRPAVLVILKADKYYHNSNRWEIDSTCDKSDLNIVFSTFPEKISEETIKKTKGKIPGIYAKILNSFKCEK